MMMIRKDPFFGCICHVGGQFTALGVSYLRVLIGIAEYYQEYNVYSKPMFGSLAFAVRQTMVIPNNVQG